MPKSPPIEKPTVTRKEATTEPPTAVQAPPQQELRLDDEGVSAIYANFCRISGTPEELVLDFGMNTRPTGELPEVIKLNQRVITNFYTAKRLLGALHMAIQRHEAAFGVLETDIRRRVTAPPVQPASTDS